MFFAVLAFIFCLLPAVMAAGSTAPISGSHMGVAYLRPGDSKVHGLNPDDYFQPASTLKLLTGVSALLYLGPDWRIITSLMVPGQAAAQGRPRIDAQGTLQSDVIIRFSADPTLTSEKLQGLLQTLSKLGVRRIAGSVILDVSRFAGKNRGNGWSWDDLPVCFTAPAAPVIIDRNCALANMQPHGEGRPVTAEVPAGIPIQIVTDAIGVKQSQYGSECELDAELFLQNRYRITGCVPIQPKNAPLPLSLAVSDPEAWGIDITEKLLRRLKISHQDIRISHTAAENTVTLASISSEPLYHLVQHMMLHSNNLYADAIAKNLAAEYFHAPATYLKASRAIRNILQKTAGIDLGNAYIVDGSGLSPHNLITPRQLLTVLSFMLREDQRYHFTALLPVAGKTGTLRWRGSVKDPPLKNNVTAKTGSLQNVNNLAGFMTTVSGRTVPFVIFSTALAYPEKTREQVRYKRIAHPSQKYERHLLEHIYQEQLLGRDFY